MSWLRWTTSRTHKALRGIFKMLYKQQRTHNRRLSRWNRVSGRGSATHRLWNSLAGVVWMWSSPCDCLWTSSPGGGAVCPSCRTVLLEVGHWGGGGDLGLYSPVPLFLSIFCFLVANSHNKLPAPAGAAAAAITPSPPSCLPSTVEAKGSSSLQLLVQWLKAVPALWPFGSSSHFTLHQKEGLSCSY